MTKRLRTTLLNRQKAVDCEPVYDSVSDRLSRFVEDGSDDCIQRLALVALDQCDQRTPVALTDHRVTLPVTESSLAMGAIGRRA